MNPIMHAVRLGLSRGWAEFKLSMTSLQEQGGNIFFVVVFIVVLILQRNAMVEGTDMSVAMLTLPSIVGMMIALGGIMGVASMLTVEREDGTLLRAKAIPNGIVGYLVARVVAISLSTVVTMVVILVPGLFLVTELAATDLGGWLTLAGVAVLGLLATLPWGAVFGSLAKSPNTLFGLVMLPMMLIIGISGIFYPITALPDWVQTIGQIFPYYWLGLGVRSAFLPDAAVVAEIGASWRPLAMVAVLGAWAVVGFLLAPVILRRMARRESGSAVAERRQQAMQRYGA
jgi:ABC-2 type transport system permease protein